ncbi:DNA methyltransferase [Terasakiella pusilla]|uniref:DNA methyltransferase n=1 Tax=Terasakiella pusilla TaxID=64973 RepID=UPI003AA96853
MKAAPKTSTVGRSKAVKEELVPDTKQLNAKLCSISCANSLNAYDDWEKPTCIVSDGAYGVLGFDGDTSDHLDLPAWYEPHIEKWSKYAKPNTTLWFWNSEIGWAVIHPILEKYGWRYVNANVWDKGKGHIAGNVNTKKIRRFPVVTEVCVQYVKEPKIDDLLLKDWLLREWKRTGLPMRKANEACGVKDVATRKYFAKDHLWYFAPPERFEAIQKYANIHGAEAGKPYFEIEGQEGTAERWAEYRAKFYCPHGFTNVWQRNSLKGSERITTAEGKAVHLNQKPLDLMSNIISASTDEGDVVWEPFGGLFSATAASIALKRKAFGAEIDQTYFYYGLKRIRQQLNQLTLL